jgi:hypothetical protein
VLKLVSTVRLEGEVGHSIILAIFMFSHCKCELLLSKKPPAVFRRSEVGNKMFQNLKMGTKMLPVAEVARDKANTGHVQRTIVSVFCRNYEAQKPFHVSRRSLWKCRTCSRCGAVHSSDDVTHLSCCKKIYISLAKYTYSFFDACYLSFAQRGLLRLYKNL